MASPKAHFLPAAALISMYALSSFFGCQKKPALAPSSDALSAIEPPPMGATTYNDELKRELAVLDDLLFERLDKNMVDKTRLALQVGDTKTLSKDPHSDQAYLVKLFLTLPELVHAKDLLEHKKLWFKAKLYFLKRRFVEAAIHMTEVLAIEPHFIEAKNLRARAIFFLGNPDMAVSELDSIIKQTPAKSTHSLDALYLIGAISYESNDMDPTRVKRGINAWENYLNLADAQGALKKEVTDGLLELRSRLAGDTKKELANRDPFAPQDKYSAEKNGVLSAFLKDELLLALELSEQALKKAYDPDIATIKARILFKTGRHDEARALYTSIVTQNPQYAPGFHYRGMAFMMAGNPKEAVASWQKTLELDRGYGMAHGLEQRIAVAQKMIEPEKIEMH